MFHCYYFSLALLSLATQLFLALVLLSLTLFSASHFCSCAAVSRSLELRLSFCEHKCTCNLPECRWGCRSALWTWADTSSNASPAWISTSLALSPHVTAVCWVPNTNTGFLAGTISAQLVLGGATTSYTAIYRTQDGGVSWTHLSTPSASFVAESIAFADASTGYAAGSNGEVFTSQVHHPLNRLLCVRLYVRLPVSLMPASAISRMSSSTTLLSASPLLHYILLGYLILLVFCCLHLCYTPGRFSMTCPFLLCLDSLLFISGFKVCDVWHSGWRSQLACTAHDRAGDSASRGSLHSHNDLCCWRWRNHHDVCQWESTAQFVAFSRQSPLDSRLLRRSVLVADWNCSGNRWLYLPHSEFR